MVHDVRALAVVESPLHLNWSVPGGVFDLRARADRARVYEIAELGGSLSRNDPD